MESQAVNEQQQECRGDFCIVTGAGDECLEVLRGVFGFDGALEDVEPTGERDALAGERAILVGGDDFFTGERVRFEDAQLTLALPFKRKWPLTKCPIKSLSTSGGYY